MKRFINFCVRQLLWSFGFIALLYGYLFVSARVVVGYDRLHYGKYWMWTVDNVVATIFCGVWVGVSLINLFGLVRDCVYDGLKDEA